MTDLNRVAGTESFAHGLNCVVHGAEDHPIVLLCAEREQLIAEAVELQAKQVAFVDKNLAATSGDPP